MQVVDKQRTQSDNVVHLSEGYVHKGIRVRDFITEVKPQQRKYTQKHQGIYTQHQRPISTINS